MTLLILKRGALSTFDAKIVNTRLTKIFIAIFAPDERLPSSATLAGTINTNIATAQALPPEQSNLEVEAGRERSLFASTGNFFPGLSLLYFLH